MPNVSTPVPHAPPRPQRAALHNNFDALRLVAALCVLVGHSHVLVGTAAPGFAGNSLHALGVKMFFAISGYLVLGSWLRDPDWGRFAARRGLRIVPGLALAVLLTMAVLGPLATTVPLASYWTDPLTWRYAWNLLLHPAYHLPGVFAGNVHPATVNGSLWSLPVEVAMYVAVPLVCWTARPGRRLALRATVAAVLVCALSLLAVHGAAKPFEGVFYGVPLAAVLDVSPYFLLGAVFHAARLERVASVPAAALLLLALYGMPPHWGWVHEAALMVVLPYACLSVGLARSVAGDWIARRGDLSYGVYLYSFPVQQWLVSQGGAAAAQPAANALFAAVPVAVLAALSWVLVERPALRWRLRLLHAQRLAAPPGAQAGQWPRGSRP